MKFYLIHLLTVCQVLLEVSCIWIEHFLSFAFRRLFISLEMYLLDSPEFSKTQLFEFLLWKLQKKTIFMMIRCVLNFSFFRFYIKTVFFMLMRYSFFSIPEYNKFLTKLAVVNWRILNDHKFESIVFSVQFIKRYFHVLWLDFVNQIQ